MSNCEINATLTSQYHSDDDVAEDPSQSSSDQVPHISPSSSLAAFVFDVDATRTVEASDVALPPNDDPDGRTSLSEAGDSRERENEVREDTVISPVTSDSVHSNEVELEGASTPSETGENGNNVRDSSETTHDTTVNVYSEDAQLEDTATPPEIVEILPSNMAKKNSTTINVVGANASDDGRRLWAPFVLTRLGLSLFTATLFLLAVSIVALFLVSDSKNGIVSVNSNYYYLWTYIPTAGKI